MRQTAKKREPSNRENRPNRSIEPHLIASLITFEQGLERVTANELRSRRFVSAAVGL
jgi:hypothetical protein